MAHAVAMLFWTRTVWVEGERQILTFSPVSFLRTVQRARGRIFKKSSILLDNPVQSNQSSNKLLLKVSIYLIYLCFSLLSAVLCDELFIIANVLCILFSSQMANRRTQCLVEATKHVFTLNIDPSGERKRCFYQCLAAHLGMKDVQGLINMLENYMLNHRLVPVKKGKMSCFRLTYNLHVLKTIRFHRSCR